MISSRGQKEAHGVAPSPKILAMNSKEDHPSDCGRADVTLEKSSKQACVRDDSTRHRDRQPGLKYYGPPGNPVQCVSPSPGEIRRLTCRIGLVLYHVSGGWVYYGVPLKIDFRRCQSPDDDMTAFGITNMFGEAGYFHENRERNQETRYYG